MMHTLNKVAVLGASGNLGPLVVKALLDSGFEVTAVTRQESSATFPSEVVVKRVDLFSVESLTEAITGQDVIVSTVAAEATDAQRIFIDAAITARVKRFVPSEFGINTREARDTKFGRFVAPKIADVDYLMWFSKKYSWFSWTSISTGAFFDWARIFDSGDEPFSGTNMAFIGKCVAASLEKSEETANSFLTVASLTTTQNEVLRVIEEETGSKFAVTRVKTSDLEKIGDEKVTKNDPTAFVELLLQYVFADGAGQAVKENAAVTVLGLQEENLRTTIKKAVAVVLETFLLFGSLE